jgi:PAS domain S-box-containing protein
VQDSVTTITSPERPTALVVNDDPSQLRLISAVLEKANIATRRCGGVEDALRSLHSDPSVALIVTDLHMPGIDGWQFCQLLRSPEFPGFNRIPILIVSATFSGSDAEQLSIELGADAFLAAPYAPSALQQYATALLSGRRPAPAPQVLMIHHDVSEADRLRAAFVEHDYGVEVAHTGVAALRAWHAHHPDVAVIDDHLPDLTVERVLAEIKKPGSRTVAFTISSDPNDRAALRLARQRADGSVPAPADAARLISLCETVRRQRSLLRIEERLEERGRALRDSEARWRSLFEAIPEIVVVHDEAGVIRHINRTGAERLEWPAHDLIGRNLDEFERRAAAGAAPHGAAENGDAAFASVYVARSGRTIPVEINRRHIAFEGQPVVLSVARDISARHELERQRQNFLAMLTHDIKNPLAIVLGFTGLLGEIGQLNDEQRDLVARMEVNANTVLTLVANYLNLTQIENGKLVVSVRPIAIAEVIESVVAQYRGHAEQQDITLSCGIEGALGVIPADPMALERVLTNLLHNALKFTPEGGRVALSARREADAVAICVADTGIGIAAAELASIFQPYRRGTLRQPREGVGLGLFIAQSLVKAHRGRIEVESVPGQGTRFTVFLPVVDAAEARAASDASAREA